jgi:NarL family two-component system response regulator LiaR
MKILKTSWFYIVMVGVVMGLLFTCMQWGHYKWTVIDHAFEFYAILIAVIFTGVGIWGGNQLMKRRIKIVEKIVEVEKPVYIEAPSTFHKEDFMAKTGISERELEVLQLIVKGASNQEIADQLFLSLSTIKTHISNIFLKLEVGRRTQAIQKAREWGIA